MVFQASDGPETAEKEIELFFQPHEIINYERVTERWIVRRS